MARIGFLGLGNMGLPMARNLAKAGHEIIAFDLSEGARQAAAEAGMTVAADAAAVAGEAESVITMLPAGQHVRAVYLGDQGLLAKAAKGTLFIDCSTIDVASSRDVHAAAAEAGFATTGSATRWQRRPSSATARPTTTAPTSAVAATGVRRPPAPPPPPQKPHARHLQ